MILPQSMAWVHYFFQEISCVSLSLCLGSHHEEGEEKAFRRGFFVHNMTRRVWRMSCCVGGAGCVVRAQDVPRREEARTDSQRCVFIRLSESFRNGDRPILSPCLSSKDVVLFPRSSAINNRRRNAGSHAKILNDNKVDATVNIAVTTSSCISIYQ
jgi:hypothetical protein